MLYPHLKKNQRFEIVPKRLQTEDQDLFIRIQYLHLNLIIFIKFKIKK